MLIYVLRVLCYATAILAVGVLPPYSRLEVPFAHVALSGDLHIILHSPPLELPALKLSISRLESGTTHLIADLPIEPSPFATDTKNSTQFTVPCGHFSKGGTYLITLRGAQENISESVQNSKLSGVLDVRWPSPKVSMTPESIQTFPESAVTSIVEFPEVMCSPLDEREEPAPAEFWLELFHCGEGGLCGDHSDGSPLYSEQVTGMPGRKEIPLRCELFGMAGTYALTLRPMIPTPTLSPTTAYLKARWSEQFVLNVHARSILPCDVHGGGVAVLVQYPACVLERADRVRVFARSAGLGAGAERPVYVAEARVSRGSHALRFSCDLFTERYPEYCFVYVSQALTGAVADVRQECLPTLPVIDGVTAAGWGPWSAWSPCSESCGGTRTRYRYCDSPPPPYGSPYCQGNAVMSEPCMGEGVTSEQCPWTVDNPSGPGSNIAADLCKCGCVLKLGNSSRQISASAQSCSGRTFWLLKANSGRVVKLQVEKYHLPCSAQWLKARDGGSPGAALLAQWPADEIPPPTVLTSSSQDLLLEFFSDELVSARNTCPGGFIATVSQTDTILGNVSASISLSGHILSSESRDDPRNGSDKSILIILGLTAAGILLAAPAICWIVLRTLHATRKYQRANDCDSLADSDMGAGSTAALSGRLGGSRGTLLSEVLSLRRLRAASNGASTGHRLLRESGDFGQQDTNNPNDVPSDSIGQNPEVWSSGSSITLAAVQATIVVNTEENLNEDRPPSGGSLPTTSSTKHPSPLRRSRTCSPARQHQTTINSMTSDCESTSMSVDMNSSERDSDHSTDIKDRKNYLHDHRFIRRTALSERSDSASTLTNGCYSPALSTTSCARVRTTGGKERKERKNLRLKAPPSDLSLAAPDLELDYYDYNVTNAGGVPGSYLGMDPAFLVWIPPLDEDEEKNSHTYEEILPRANVDPGSNTESPEDLPGNLPLPKRRLEVEHENISSSPKIDRKLLTKLNIVHPLNFSVSDLAHSKNSMNEALDKIDGRKKEYSKKDIPSESIHMHTIKSNIQHPLQIIDNNQEKETTCEKSLGDKYSDMSDIQFADDDSENDEEEIYSQKDNKKVESRYDSNLYANT